MSASVADIKTVRLVPHLVPQKTGVKNNNASNGLGATKAPHWIRCPKRLYTLKEAAMYLGRTVRGVRELIWSGKIPYVNDGRKFYVDIKDLEAYVERNKSSYC